MSKRRRLGRAHRAAISRGLKRYYRRQARVRARRNKAARVRRALKKQQAALPKRIRDTEEWELTFRYSKKGKAIGWTMRIIAPRGTSRDVIHIVARRRGQGQTEPGFRVELGNWQQELRSGRVKEFPAYEPADVPGWHALFNAGQLRIERVKE